jgi:outer membrane protein OmpA-like peptidoglycan-associated protein
MMHRTSARIRVSGHTDNLGNPKKNQALSEARAKSVRDYLMARGIDGSRIEAVGYGDQQPVASNDTEEGRQQNRRIEAIEL